MSGPVAAAFRALGTTATVVVTEASVLEPVVHLVARRVDELDRAASRFRADSELTRLNRSEGQPVEVSETLFDALRDALRAAEETDGLLDPTVGAALERCGYDRDFASVPRSGLGLGILPGRVPGWHTVRLDRRARRVTVPQGVRVDLGATAKARCADRTASESAESFGCGVLVNLGGDVAVAGAAPRGGWALRIADRHDAGPTDPGVTVAITSGGVATSGTAARRWLRGDEVMHHLIDPCTGLPARTCWRTVTVAGASCLKANVASTATMILGSAGPSWLSERDLPARLVGNDGSVLAVGGWPADLPEAATPPPGRSRASC